ncbi:MAG: D-alanyl-D-alanine carboxypeptidase [Burkholderiales bacterium]|jgi:D-alanyl-D-alanine carboxypeptidase (penicillin-binding protein 5/6)|nr:D-alanyl-D-alanine carboxypeptidase [Burkholderiales bacterium]
MSRLARLLSALLLSFVVASAWAQAPAALRIPPPPVLTARAWVLIDWNSGQVLVEKDADVRMPPASITKLMTAWLTFDALRDKRITQDQTVIVSQNAVRQSGSRMFLDPRLPVTVEQLLRGLIVQSGNDAAVALAELIGGTEAGFVERMNREAARMGLASTHFVNATGLHDAQHYSTPRDLATLGATLIRDFPQGFAIYSQREFTWNGISQANRNKLLWMDPFVDGLKTGHTPEAGWCLVATAKRDRRRLLSVVMAAPTEIGRAQESQKLLNYGFQWFDGATLFGPGRPVSQLAVWKGATRTVPAGFPDGLALSVPRGAAPRLKASLTSRQPLIAPIAAGETVGTLRLTLDDRTLGEYPVVALEGVTVANVLVRLWDTIRLWFQ